MASAAAVGADQARSPAGNDIGDDRGLPGEITSGIYSKEEGIPDGIVDVDKKRQEEEDEDEDDDEDLPSNPLRGRRPDRAVNGDAEEDDGHGLDMFGDDAADTEKPAYALITRLTEIRND